jgi:phosphatidate phosphatase APP1
MVAPPRRESAILQENERVPKIGGPLHRVARRIDDRFDRLPDQDGPIVIHPYRSFGRSGELIVRGRVLFEKKVAPASGDAPLWRNVLDTYRRFRSAEIRDMPVIARYGDDIAETVTDIEGHFEMTLLAEPLLRDVLWHEVLVELPNAVATTVSHVLVPPIDAEFGVISDIDDTVVQTGATSLLTMVKSLMENAAGRVAFPGVADLYNALHRHHNPLFYVSSSPWNLYDLLHDFMNLNGIPAGPMLLQDWGIDEQTMVVAAHSTHKLAHIQRLLDYYPALPFVLIGDSGQHDPEIYLQVIRSNPGRIRTAFIRDVSDDQRDAGVARIIEEAATAGAEMLFVPSSDEAMEHARRMGLV